MRKTPRCRFGYAGPKNAGVGGWCDDYYVCINPFHYGETILNYC